METTERIIEAYIRYCRDGFTNTNIHYAGTGDNEVDILAIAKDIKHEGEGERKEKKSRKYYKYHIESSVSNREKLKINGSNHSNVNYFLNKKFKGKNLSQVLKEFGFTPKSYRKVIVTWEIHEEHRNDVKDYVRKYNEKHKKDKIEIWELKEKMKFLRKMVKTSKYSDDILRTIQLIKMI